MGSRRCFEVAADIKAPAGLARLLSLSASRRQPPALAALIAALRYKVLLKDGNYPSPTATSAAAATPPTA
jgi:hypothetical protein